MKNSQLTPGKLMAIRAAILLALKRESNYSQGLVEMLQRMLKVEVSYNTVYSALQALEGDQLIVFDGSIATPPVAQQERGGRPRIYYRLTDAGDQLAVGFRTLVREL